ncbi:hypothetical protein [Comamonas guangdongensis]|uniref:Lipoprotein n=1 Tax=Comamonas guangdongensis TaxID=510515 RepID=A0ABV3ZUY5_9BURK
MRAIKTRGAAARTLGLLACVLLLGACGKQAEAPAAAPQAQASAAPAAKRVVDQLLSVETIGMNLAQVKKLAGPAVHSEAHRHLLRTDGCDITLLSDEADKVVQAVEVALAPSCQVSLQPLLGSLAGTPPQLLGELSMGRFEQLLGGAYYADCLSMCGNAADPVVSLIAEGPRALQLMEFAVTVQLVAGPALEAADKWRDAMQKAESEDYVLDTRFNCEPERFKDVVGPAFAAIKPTSFVFGSGLGFQSGECD